MHSHPNARMTQTIRFRLINQHLLHHRPLAELAVEAGISFRCAYKWLARYRSGGPASMADRRSVRRTQLRTLDSNRHKQHPPLREADDAAHAAVQQRLEEADQIACSSRRIGGLGGQESKADPEHGAVGRAPSQIYRYRLLTGPGRRAVSPGYARVITLR